jgi:hypothetical protein
VNYVVRAAVGVTLASALLPHFINRTFQQGRPLFATLLAAGFLLSLAVVFTAAIHRTVSVADAAAASRKEEVRKLEAARANVETAEQALTADRQVTAGECKTGVGKECKRLASEGKGILQTTIDLRSKLADAKEPVEDSTPAAISALTRGLLSEEQVRRFQPMLVPISVSALAGLLITLGIGGSEAEPSLPRTPATTDLARRWWWRRRKAAAEIQAPVTSPEIEARVPDRPRPKLAASTRQPIGAVLDFLHDGLEIIAGPRTEMADAFIGYAAWCRAQSSRPLDVAKFVEEMEGLCRQFGIRVAVEGDRHYLIDVQLASARVTA